MDRRRAARETNRSGDMIGWGRTAAGLVTAVGATVPLATAQALALRLNAPDKATLPRLWHRSCLQALGIRVRVTGRMETSRPLLLAANHVSWTDIHVLGSLGNVTFIAKSEVGRWPVIGWLSRLQRTVFIDRSQRRTTGDQAREIGQRLAAGEALVLFAEGTTSDGNFVSPFRSSLFGAASIALEAGAPAPVAVQPVAIAYTRFHGMPMGRYFRRRAAWIGDQDLLPHVLQLLEEGALDVEVVFGEPIAYRGDADRKAVAREAERQVRALMAAALRGAA